MAEVTLIKKLAFNLILALESVSSADEIFEGFESALDEYENLLTTLDKAYVSKS
jgi:hypothetical protein